MSPSPTPSIIIATEAAQLSAGILNITNISEDSKKFCNKILERSLSVYWKEIDRMLSMSSIAEPGMITQHTPPPTDQRGVMGLIS